MPKYSDACAARMKHAVQFLIKNPCAKVWEAMLVAQFWKKKLGGKNLCHAIAQQPITLLPPSTIQCASNTLTDLLCPQGTHILTKKGRKLG